MSDWSYVLDKSYNSERFQQYVAGEWVEPEVVRDEYMGLVKPGLLVRWPYRIYEIVIESTQRDYYRATLDPPGVTHPLSGYIVFRQVEGSYLDLESPQSVFGLTECYTEVSQIKEPGFMRGLLRLDFERSFKKPNLEPREKPPAELSESQVEELEEVLFDE